MEVLANKEGLTGQIKAKLHSLNEKWRNSSGKFGEISVFVDDLLTAKCNLEKVVAILRDYENLDDEVEELNAKLDDEQNTELLSVYRKLKMLNFVRIKLMERIDSKWSSPLRITFPVDRNGHHGSAAKFAPIFVDRGLPREVDVQQLGCTFVARGAHPARAEGERKIPGSKRCPVAL